MPLLEDFPPAYRELLAVKGEDILERLGSDRVRDVVAGILGGDNVRAVTEAFTRLRVAHLSAALAYAFVSAKAADPDLPKGFPQALAASRSQGGLAKADRWILQWALGLTDKQFQNVLRSDYGLLSEYAESFEAVLAEAADEANRSLGVLEGQVAIGDTRATLDWPTVLSMLTAVGQMALAIRGSEKSLYGKLFEKLILVGALHVLGFEFAAQEAAPEPGVQRFWLTSRDEKRESDATALVGEHAIRFDIGFIGIGNPEILLDKVSRFERRIEIEGRTFDASPIILGDRVAENSSIANLATDIGGTIVEMSKPDWLGKLGEAIKAAAPEYESPLPPEAEREPFVRGRLADAPEEIFEAALTVAMAEDEETQGG